MRRTRGKYLETVRAGLKALLLPKNRGHRCLGRWTQWKPAHLTPVYPSSLLAKLRGGNAGHVELQGEQPLREGSFTHLYANTMIAL